MRGIDIMLRSGYYTDKDRFTGIYYENEPLYSEECANELNHMVERIENLKQEVNYLNLKVSIHKHPLWSTREAEKKVKELQNEVDILKVSNEEMEDYLARLEEKNEQLKSKNKKQATALKNICEV